METFRERFWLGLVTIILFKSMIIKTRIVFILATITTVNFRLQDFMDLTVLSNNQYCHST